MSTLSPDNRRPPRSSRFHGRKNDWTLVQIALFVVIVAIITLALVEGRVFSAPKPLSQQQIELLAPAAREAYYTRVELEAEAHQACVDADRKDAGCADQAVNAALESVR